MKVMLTGGTGFLGEHLARRLMDSGHGVKRCLLRMQEDRDKWYWTLDKHKPDCIIHLAAQVEVGRGKEDPHYTFTTNTLGTLNVLEGARQVGVRRVIVASSDKAYGHQRAPYAESMLPQASDPYSTSKACADMIADTYQRTYGMSVAVTRCANLYGPGHTNWTALIPGTARDICEGRQPVIRSDGTLKRDYLFIDDALDAYLALVESRKVGAFNFGTGYAVSVLDVVTTMLKLMGRSNVEPLIAGEAGGEIREQWLDSTRAKTELRWQARHSLSEGLDKTIPWYRKFFGMREA